MMKVHDSVIHPWNYVVTPFPVADHVYYVGNRWVGSYLLDSGKGLILIDSDAVLITRRHSFTGLRSA